MSEDIVGAVPRMELLDFKVFKLYESLFFAYSKIIETEQRYNLVLYIGLAKLILIFWKNVLITSSFNS